MKTQRDLRKAVAAAVSLAALVALSGCTTFGGNVKGDFSCKAPDGICAPSSTIDDRALAMISGDAGDIMIPAGPYQELRQKPRGTRTALASPESSAASAAPRTREKVLRIVFQPYIDERGRLHEASAVHAVVQSEWQAQALADATPIPDRRERDAPAQLSLADAVERETDEGIVAAAIDPNLPDPAVVAAARARKLDPVAAIKADVSSRLAAQRKEPASPFQKPALADGRTGADPRALTVAAPAADATIRSGDLNPGTSQRPAHKDTTAPSLPDSEQVQAETARAAAAAADRVKSSEAYRERKAEVTEGARDAAVAAPASGLKSLTSPTVRAANFPASVAEEN